MSSPDFEKAIDDFEQSWRRNQPPNWSQLELGGSAELLMECVVIDMEFRWKFWKPPDDALGGKPRLEDYVALLPALEASSLSGIWVAEEYRIRKTIGDSVTHEHFLNRFPYLNVEDLKSALLEVDRETVTERSSKANTLPSSYDQRAPLKYSDFELLSHLGTGGMGKVYRSKQKSLDRTVAVKSLRKSRQDDPLAVEQFLLEAKLLGRLDHENIVRVHGVGRFPAGGFFIAMELVVGSNLDQVSIDDLSTDQIMACCRGITDAIRHAHGNGVVHCDLKPSNILVTNGFVPKVADFGLGQLMTSVSSADTIHGGTGPYLAPERRHAARAEPTLDIFGIGAILLFLLTGRSPNVGGDLKLPTKEEFSCREMKEGIADLCRRCLQPNPADRFAHATEVLAELERLA